MVQRKVGEEEVFHSLETIFKQMITKNLNLYCNKSPISKNVSFTEYILGILNLTCISLSYGPRHRRDLKEAVINMTNWVDSTQDRDYQKVTVNAALNLQIP